MAEVELRAKAPDFTLDGQAGIKNVPVVFNYMFTLPFCRAHMAQLHRYYLEFVRQNSV